MASSFDFSKGPESLAPFVDDLTKRRPYRVWDEPPEYFYDVTNLSHLAEMLDFEDDLWDSVPPASKVRLSDRTVVLSAESHILLAQPTMRLDALRHYVETPDVLFDPIGYYDNALPVVYDLGESYLVLDGTHRVLAALWTGRSVEGILAECKDDAPTQ